MSSDPTPQAQRLVESCAEAARKERVRSLRETGRSASDEQQAARSVVAVLRELAADNWFDSVIRNDLRALADSIEKGGDDGTH